MVAVVEHKRNRLFVATVYHLKLPICVECFRGLQKTILNRRFAFVVVHLPVVLQRLAPLLPYLSDYCMGAFLCAILSLSR